MLEMWKVIDAFSKCAWYGTDEHQKYCEQRLQQVVKEIDSAVAVSVSIDGGPSISLMKIMIERKDGDQQIGVSYYVSPAHLAEVRRELLLEIQADNNKVRVDITARELNTAEKQ